MKYLLYIVAAAVLVNFTSCKKDKDNNNNGPKLNPKVEMLTGANQKLWGFSSAKKNGIETLADCQKDNLILYKVNMTVVVDEGPLKCIASGEQNTTAAWEFNTAEDSILYISGGVAEGYKIDFISANELKLSVTDSIAGTDSSYLYQVTFVPR